MAIELEKTLFQEIDLLLMKKNFLESNLISEAMKKKSHM